MSRTSLEPAQCQRHGADSIELATRTPLPVSRSSSPFAPSASRMDALDSGRPSLAPVDTGFGAWSFVPRGIQANVWGFPNAFGVFLKAYLDDPVISGQPHAASILPLIGTLSSGVIYCSGPFIYPFTSRYPHHRRTAMWVGTALCWASLFGASYATTITQLLCLQGMLYAVGGSLLWAPTLSYLPEWFVRRRGLANGHASPGTAAAGVLLPLIMPPLIRAHGTALTLRYLSTAILLSMLPALPFVRPRLPEHRVHGPGPRSLDNAWVKSWTWWLLLAANTVQGFAYFLPVIWLPTYASSVGSTSTSSLSIALLNGASLFGRVTLGTLSDHLSPWLLATTTLASTSLVTFTLWGVVGRDAPFLLLFGVLYGLLAGSWSSLWTGFLRPITRNDTTLSTNLVGFLLFSRGIGNVLSTPISIALRSTRARSGIAHQKTGFDVADGRFENMIVYVGTCFAGVALVAMVGWGGDRVLKKRAAAP
ncbi:MFS general substrate transporter [Auriscalpium vulgare]|uniref:MFS general substrate transporter n=1 Tax=Auriscalpium vulgare TaxID=40419 RepID=A0ACB8REG2_9AGAM|nr:MFS general substrate transporter [Auriscalpium vulgare]